MRKKVLYYCAALILAVGPFFGGCRVTTDPETGKKAVQVDPNAAAKIEPVAATTVDILTLLSPLVPALGPAAALLAGILAAWLKIKPKLTKAQSEAEMYHSSTASLVAAIESFKATNPAEWQKLKDLLGDNMGPKIENIIRALRGLPPIE